MRYSYKIFVSIVVILGLGFSGYGYWLMKEVRQQYSLAIEDSLVDFSRIVAGFLSVRAEQGQLNTSDFQQVFQHLSALEYQAHIHGVSKDSNPINAYITDENGIVVFDSRTPKNIGKDYSKWNDVYLTLKGQYGARSTRADVSDPLSSVFYVAAPIFKDGRIIGSVSLIKPEQSLRDFFEMGRKKILLVMILILLAAICIAALFSYWLTRPIEALISYAKRVSHGESIRPPRSTTKEFMNLGTAFDEMRISLEGKRSVESFVQHLSHELKSPLSAIQAAAELLKDDMPPEKRKMFLSNIETESQRARRQLDELLELASLESRKSLSRQSAFSLKTLIHEVEASMKSLFEKKNLRLEANLSSGEVEILGERDLIFRVFCSLLSNAVEFSPHGAKIQVDVMDLPDHVQIYVRDQGPGIPDYARARIFEKFFSLERPDTGKKSTGLGLSFVKEVVALHAGHVEIAPSTPEMSGANIRMTLNK